MSGPATSDNTCPIRSSKQVQLQGMLMLTSGSRVARHLQVLLEKCEVGLMIEPQSVAGQTARAFDSQLPQG
jgi:hypothetical protein